MSHRVISNGKDALDEDNVAQAMKYHITVFSTKCNRPGIVEKAQHALSPQIIQGISQRIMKGTTAELSNYIHESLDMPLGLKISLYDFLVETFLAGTVEKQSQSATKLSMSFGGIQIHHSHESAKKSLLTVWEEWKLGKLQPEQYFKSIHQLVFQGILTATEAKTIISFSLERAGWGDEKKQLDVTKGEKMCTHERLHQTTSVCAFTDLQAVHCTTYECEMHSFEGSFSNLQIQSPLGSADFIEETVGYHNKQYRKNLAKSGILWWEHRGGFENLIVSGTRFELLSPSSPTRLPTVTDINPKSVLLIGDCIHING